MATTPLRVLIYSRVSAPFGAPESLEEQRRAVARLLDVDPADDDENDQDADGDKQLP